MNLRHPTCVFAAAFALATLVSTAFADVNPVKVSDNIYVFKGLLANCSALVTDEGVLVIDSGETAELGNQLLASVRSVSNGKPVRYLVNTHLHFDHTNGNAAFAKAGAIIVAQDNMFADFTTRISPPNTTLPSREAWPTVTFSRDVTLRLGDEEILVRHPETDGAHTNGDSFVYFRRANVLATGDIMFNGMYPSIDTAEGGWARGIATSCREAAALIDDNTVVIPGHGKITNKQGLLHYADMLDDISGNVGDLVAKGMTLDEIIASHPTAKWDKEFGKSVLYPPFAVPPDYFVQCVYNGMISHKQAAK